jgi:16S rRNA (guanine527-N7)-methyltransferase
MSLLVGGAAALGVGLPPQAAERLIAYLALLQKWNAVYNLTAVRGGEQMVTRLVLDSLSVVPYIKGPRVLDLGTGAGLPGIPLALALPEYELVLLDSNLKKIRFLRQVVGDLGLGNVTVERGRVEEYRPATPFDTVVVRAFGSITEIVASAARLCRPQGLICAMKGRYPKAELEALPPGCRLEGVERLRVPGLEAERYLVKLAIQAS